MHIFTAVFQGHAASVEGGGIGELQVRVKCFFLDTLETIFFKVLQVILMCFLVEPKGMHCRSRILDVAAG